MPAIGRRRLRVTLNARVQFAGPTRCRRGTYALDLVDLEEISRRAPIPEHRRRFRLRIDHEFYVAANGTPTGTELLALAGNSPSEWCLFQRLRGGVEEHVDAAEHVDNWFTTYDPDILVHKVPQSLLSDEGFAAVIMADIVFGCVNHDGLRFVLNELAVAYEKPLIDAATDVPEPGVNGGRIFFGRPGDACLACMQLLDMLDVRRFFLSNAERQAEDAIYGVRRRLLNVNGSGPAVVTINMATAGLAGTEFMVWATRMRHPQRLITYYANRSVVTVSRDEPRPDCYYCKLVRGQRNAANVQRYLQYVAQRAAA